MALEQTLVILKPDAVERVLVRIIVNRFKQESLKVIAMKKLRPIEEQLDKHFPATEQWLTDMGIRACRRITEEIKKDPVEHFGSDNPFTVGTLIRKGCIEYYSSGPLVVLVLEGNDAVTAVRKLIGKTLPSQAERGTIRGDFGIPENPKSVVATRNLVHASDSPEEAKREIATWFTLEELGKDNL